MLQVVTLLQFHFLLGSLEYEIFWTGYSCFSEIAKLEESELEVSESVAEYESKLKQTEQGNGAFELPSQC